MALCWEKLLLNFRLRRNTYQVPRTVPAPQQAFSSHEPPLPLLLPWCGNNTSFIRFGGRERGHEAVPSCVSVWDHLHHHLVAAGHQGCGPERAAEAPDALAVAVAAVHVHEVVAAQAVALQVYEPEIENDNFPLGNLPRKSPVGNRVMKTAWGLHIPSITKVSR